MIVLNFKRRRGLVFKEGGSDDVEESCPLDRSNLPHI